MLYRSRTGEIREVKMQPKKIRTDLDIDENFKDIQDIEEEIKEDEM
jgi:hypothetical protein